ncbi:hypothetical protein [Streptomyces coelicoflavus]|uniref:hypothetical protein n=1 Tax=Streptomyces coelicoflavus TaxID=285562 RepID=UPI003F49EB7A
MSSRSRAAAGLAAGAAMAAVAVLGGAAPAQAYNPDPSATIIHRDTDGCPCSGGSLGDPFDGTYFKHDAGGKAVKIELSDDGWFIGKVEFHPYGNKIWVYDTKNDGDGIYVHVAVDNHDGHGLTGWNLYHPPGTDKVVDYSVNSLGSNVREGADIRIRVFDDSRTTDLITTAWGVA